jgi:hypothetical protein
VATTGNDEPWIRFDASSLHAYAHHGAHSSPQVTTSLGSDSTRPRSCCTRPQAA